MNGPKMRCVIGLNTVLLTLWLQSVQINSCCADGAAFLKPSAIGFLPHSNQALICDEQNGSLISVSLSQEKVVQRLPLGRRLIDIAVRTQNDQAVVLDEQTKELILVSSSPKLVELDRRIVSGNPKYLAVAENGSIAAVSHPWSRQIDFVEIGSDRFLDGAQHIELSFEPGSVLWIDSSELIVADAFGGNLSFIDLSEPKLVQQFKFRGHNIGGLTLSADRQAVLITHQLLSPVARTDFDDIHWGNLIQNVISRIPLSAFKSSDKDLNRNRKLTFLGDTGRGFADPGDILETEFGVLVLSRGANLAMLISNNQSRRMIQNVGKNPLQLVQVAEDQFISIARFSPELLRFKTSGEPEITAKIQIGEIEQSPRIYGESLFYDASLSHDGWMSCNSCHVDGHTAGLRVDTLGDGDYGNPKVIPSLLGVSETVPFGWLGNKATLEDQILATLRSTMHGQSRSGLTATKSSLLPTDLEATQIGNLVAYLQTLNPADSPEPDEAQLDTILKGRAAFERFDCVRCHQAASLTSPEAFDVGLVDELGIHQFNPPSLRGAKHRRALFHDGRAEDIPAVIRQWRHQIPDDATEPELESLEAYLKHL